MNKNQSKLSKFIYSLASVVYKADEKAAKLFNTNLRTIQSWRKGARTPNKKAMAIIVRKTHYKRFDKNEHARITFMDLLT